MKAFIRRIFRSTELRTRILFTLAILVVCRVGIFIPVPGINGSRAVEYFQQTAGVGQNLFRLADIFSGGAFAQMTVFALGVVPYISASIIIQLLLAFMPNLQREVRENPESGKRKIGKYTRLFTVFLAVVQSSFFAKFILQMNLSFPGLVVSDILNFSLFGMPFLFYFVTVLVMATGTLLLMWLGERISDRGIGNGVSLIITLGILSSVPSVISSLIRQLNLGSQEPGQISFFTLGILACLFAGVLVATIWIIEGERKIPVQHARRMVGRGEMIGGSSYIPLKVNYAGVIPVIFASSLLMFPATLSQFLGKESKIGAFLSFFLPGNWLYSLMYVLLILFFTYFWTATQFHPEQIASEMKRNNAFIPGLRQGKPTQNYLEQTMSRVTFIGSVFLALIAVLPNLIGGFLKVGASVTYFFGGTALLIVVGVILDTMKQIKSFLLTKQYDGFMKKDKSKGRY
ncbi:Protein translocase subunit SecY [Candidatus Clavichlamydia salmonicola]|uniref:preprotein translocase subunit SecY n=1 Tax=Candidatus Clavichlamydia salmonicola TaxID=469812 RepID=UPI0018911C29|nr:preprotein translocase subunit SecY [Candidatus Clavichlamydia salmonicola]MBF5050764.1 Protein translocase subunit SecY [Candidatus Clavichlamydia salmonicola]